MGRGQIHVATETRGLRLQEKREERHRWCFNDGQTTTTWAEEKGAAEKRTRTGENSRDDRDEEGFGYKKRGKKGTGGVFDSG